LLPLEGRETVLALRALEDIARSHGFDLPVTLNFDAHATLVAITNLAFDRRRGEQVAAAHRCAQAMEAWIERRGLAPYRLRADSLRTRPPAEHDLPERRAHWEQMARLKRAFDPDGVVAPGRYVAGEPGGEAGSP
jgi:4-cresol dehydrogenase (hydroxylating)